MNVFSERFVVEFDRERDACLIIHPDRERLDDPLIDISRETLEAMSYKQAAQFIGERLILLTPGLNEIFQDYLWTDGGHTPPKRT